jgi:hypothetical protein
MFTANTTEGAPQGLRAHASSATEDDPSGAGFSGLAQAVADCAAAGASTSTDPFSDAVAVWMALHGYATLRASMAFPWPDEESTLEHLVLSLARIAATARP